MQTSFPECPPTSLTSGRFDGVAIFIGIQPGVRHLPAVELYNLLVDLGPHPKGSTVSRNTILRYLS